MTDRREQGRASAGGRGVSAAISGYLLVLVAISVQQTWWPASAGLPALGEVFAPYLFAPLLLALPWAPRRRSVALALGAGLAVFLLRFPPHLPVAHAADGPSVTVLSWNVRLGGQWPAIRDVLATTPADIVALVESDGAGLHGDPALMAHYPTAIVVPGEEAAEGLTLLSRYPLRDHGLLRQAPGLPARGVWAELDVGRDDPLLVAMVHPEAPDSQVRTPSSPAWYNAGARDATLAAIRAFLDPALRAGTPVLVLGDANLTEREPAYAAFSVGLTDAQRAVGLGPGLTWRPAPLMGWDGALLRLDYLFSNAALTPQSVHVDCTPRGSDHCLVRAAFTRAAP